MKTAEEWVADFYAAMATAGALTVARAIQRDALESAAKICEGRCPVSGLQLPNVQGSNEPDANAEAIRALMPENP